ncbi:MAG: hypothetical protein JW757_01810 [Anaerolineales bacterium]|nr:hypothetical protein [Anaerolineales bacterium]
MTIPAFVLGSVIAALMGAVTHLILGGSFGRLVVLILTGLVAFWFGHILGNIVGLKFLNIGAINLGPAVLVTAIGLAGAGWLSAIDRGGERS